MHPPNTITIHAAAVACPRAPRAAPPGHHLRVTAAAAPGALAVTVTDISTHPGHRPGAPILFPAIINAHTHLDLTPIGPVPRPPGQPFATWITAILEGRRIHTDQFAATNLGIATTLAGPTAAVADIAGVRSLEPARALLESPLAGISLVELFGFGPNEQPAIDALPTAVADIQSLVNTHPASIATLALQPHAPYSAGRRLFDAIADATTRSIALANLVATHLAESPDEREFLAQGTGPMRDFLESIRSWADDHAHDIATAESPVAHLAPHLRRCPALLAHVNDASDRDIDTLAELQRHWIGSPPTHTPTAATPNPPQGGVAFCPRGHTYFEHPEHYGPHRFNDMLDAGINVALGTDSIVNLPPDQADRLSTLDDARFLHDQHHADPTTLLRLITTSPARMLGLDASRFTFGEHTLAGLACCAPAGHHTTDANRALMDARDPGCLAWDGERWHPSVRTDPAPKPARNPRETP